MQRHVTSLPISNSLKAKLAKGGIEGVNELKQMKPTDLCKDCCLSKAELAEIYETLEMTKSSKLVSVFDMLKQDEAEKKDQNQHISLLANGLDSILGGGIPLGKITEVCGSAGAGKTQLCMQLCISVQLPTSLGGLSAKAVYIDTEGSFVKSRLEEMSLAIRESVESQFNLSKNSDLLSSFTPERILKNIFYCRCQDHVQLIATINNIKGLIDREPNIKLVIVDSIASPFRFVDFKDSNSLAMKTNLLNNLITNANNLITTHNIAFVVINQMTTRIIKDSYMNTSSSTLVPALGESWAHSANIRLLLSWKNTYRVASVVKCSYLPERPVFYKITSSGLTDVHEVTTNEEDENDESNLDISLIITQVKRKRPTDE